jgi:hypothetical protein
MLIVVEDRVRGFDHLHAAAVVYSGVQIAVESGKIAAADLEPQSMSFPKQFTG